MQKPNLVVKEDRMIEEAQRQRARGDFAHSWAITMKARVAGVVRRQKLGDSGTTLCTPACYARAVRGRGRQEKWGSGTALLRR